MVKSKKISLVIRYYSNIGIFILDLEHPMSVLHKDGDDKLNVSTVQAAALDLR